MTEIEFAAPDSCWEGLPFGGRPLSDRTANGAAGPDSETGGARFPLRKASLPVN